MNFDVASPQAMPAGYKPSPLGPYGSPRSSPFRRPDSSPASPSAVRQTSTQVTPSGSPTKASYASNNGRFGNPSTPTEATESKTPTPRVRTPTGGDNSNGIDNIMTSPLAARPGLKKTVSHGSALTQLQPAQVRTLREGFEILDRDSDGVINREDVADMLNQLGLPANASDVSQFFPPSTPQTMTMASFLNSLATMLASLSPQSELLSAFSAFDDDDSGQINLNELRDALLHTAPEPGERPLTEAEVEKVIEGFTGRRAFSRNMQGGLGKRGEVFRYQDFVNSIMGSNTSSEPNSAEGSED
ncbi:calcium-binding ef-hand protein [Colletotrichum plurivorum]|uniref:Calcium-binding ef-hand protein n=1 Tax=Colletotrichum plurivorum TaxID=2175906 RepID=A0A8H6KVH6_9PEZI|nr:calcium-binding ef-hand protein [Colletotrichum plurivorum]